MTSTSATSIRIGSYQLGERVGEGGSAEVFAAVGKDGRDVAIKLLGPHAELDDPKGRSRFEREIEILSAIDHPHLVALLDSGYDDELGPYLVTELVRGTSLREHLGLGPDIAALFAAPVAAAGVALHRAGLVHRDLKPENVLVSESGRVVLIDLGLALRAGQTRFTDEGEVTGSVPYMSPEQIEGRDIAEPADVWALGVLVYELISGRRPFERPRASEEAAAILVGSCPRLDSLDERVSPALSDLVHQCLDWEPQNRPSAEQLAVALHSLVDYAPDASDEVRRRYLTDAAGLSLHIASHRVRSLRSEVTDGALAPFAAIRRLSRALAYAPGDPSLGAELAAIQAQATPRALQLRDTRGKRLAYVAAAVVFLAAIGIGAALVPDTTEAIVLEDVSIARPEPAPPPSVAGHIADALLGDVPEKSKSDVAAKRVANGMIHMLGRSLSAERDEKGKLVAAKGASGASSNEELTLDVFGGMLDLFEEGMAAKHNRGRELAASPTPKQSESVTIARPRNLRDDDEPRDLTRVMAPKGEALLHMPGRSRAQIRAMLAEVRRQRAKNKNEPNLRVIEAVYMIASGDEAAGIALLEVAQRQLPSIAYAQFVAGRISLRRGQLRSAEKAVNKGLSTEPKSADGLAMRGRIRYMMGRTKSAFDDLRRALMIDQKDSYALFTLAELLLDVVGRDTAGPLIRQLQILSLDSHAGPVALDYLARLCRFGARMACAGE